MVSSPWYLLFFLFIVLFLYKSIVQDRAHSFYNTCICLFFWITCVYNGSVETLQVVVIFYFGDCQFFFLQPGTLARVHWPHPLLYCCGDRRFYSPSDRFSHTFGGVFRLNTLPCHSAGHQSVSETPIVANSD